MAFDIYEAIENGDDVHEDIADMTIDEMMDYFGDMDPIEFL
jgi:hypothetical protein